MSQFKPATVIVPVREGQAAVVQRFVAQIPQLISGRIELLFLHMSLGSSDRSVYQAVRQAQNANNNPNLRITSRTPSPRKLRLGTAAMIRDGVAQAWYGRVVVIDPVAEPQVARQLLMDIRAGQSIVVASRYRKGGGDAMDGFFSRFWWMMVTLIVRIVFWGALKGVTDPFSNVFAFDRDKVEPTKISTRSFKLLPEILATHPHLDRSEVPIWLPARESRSLTDGHRRRLLRRLLALRVRTLPPWVRFGFCGGAIAMSGAFLLWSLVQLGVEPLVANVVTLAATLLFGFVLAWLFVWRGQPDDAFVRQLVLFFFGRGLVQGLSWLVYAALLREGLHYQMANATAVAVGAPMGYWVSRHIFDATAGERLVRAIGHGFHALLWLASFAAAGYGWYMLHMPWLANVVLGAVALSTVVGMFDMHWRAQSLQGPEPTHRANRLVLPRRRELFTRFTIIIPARNEASSIASTLQSVLRSKHPYFRVIVSLCDGDYATMHVVNEVSRTHPDGWRVCVVGSDAKSSKSQLVSAALAFLARQSGIDPHDSNHYVGVFDAACTIHPDLLLRAERLIRQSDADIVQGGARLENLGAGLRQWSQVHNALEYHAWFAGRMTHQPDSGFVPLSGNSAFVRYGLVQHTGEWPLNLIEDCALGIMLSTQFGAKVATAYDPIFTAGQGSTPKVFSKAQGSLFFQRVRWNQRFFAELVGGSWLQMPKFRQKLFAGYILAAPFLQALVALIVPGTLVAAFVLKLSVVLTMAAFVPLVPVVLSVVTQLVGLHDIGRSYEVKVKLWHYASVLLMAWPYQLLLGAAAVYAAARQLRGNTTIRQASDVNSYQVQAPADFVSV